jgi:hypothetical protein
MPYDLSDSEPEDDEMMDDQNGGGEAEDLSQFTVDTFNPQPLKGETAINTVSLQQHLLRYHS